MPSPIVSSTLQATALASASNILAQLLSSYNKNEPPTLNIPDFLRFLILTLLTAPPNFCWQMFLERTFPGRNILPAKPCLPYHEEIHEETGLVEEEDTHAESKLDWRNTMTKWFIDCMTVGALLNTAAFLIIMGLLKNRSLGEIGVALRTELFPIIYASYKIWPVASVINFSLIPAEKRVVFLSAVGLFWGIFLSLTAARQ